MVDNSLPQMSLTCYLADFNFYDGFLARYIAL